MKNTTAYAVNEEQLDALLREWDTFEAMVSEAHKALGCYARTRDGARHALRWMQIGGIWTEGDRARAEALRRIIVANKTPTV